MNKILKKITVVTLAVLIFAISAFTFSCKKPESQESTPKSDVTLTLDKTSVTVEEGGEFYLVATTNSTRSVSWKSSNESILSVNGLGRVFAKTVGTADIIANAEGVTAKCSVTVTQAQQATYSYVKLDKAVEILTMEIPDGETSPKTAKITPKVISVTDGIETEQTGKTFTFKSLDESVVTVSADGVVTPKRVGQTSVTVEVDDLQESVLIDVYSAGISTPEEWLSIINGNVNVHGIRFYLENDLDFTGVEYDIGDLATAGTGGDFFGGEINGNYHSVKNITLKGTSQSLFGATVGMVLRNISFENARITEEATTSSGLAMCWMQHRGNEVFKSLISNVYLDLVFDNKRGSGIAENVYGINVENVFVKMRRTDGKTFDEFPTVQVSGNAEGGVYVEYDTNAFMIFSRWAVDWNYAGPSTARNVIGYSENGQCGLLQMIYGKFVGDNNYFAESKIDASYLAFNLFDGKIWEISPNEDPILKG